MGLNVEGGYWASILHSYCTIISFPEFGHQALGLFLVCLEYGYIYFIYHLNSTCTLLFSEMKLFIAVVKGINWVTIAMDSIALS